MERAGAGTSEHEASTVFVLLDRLSVDEHGFDIARAQGGTEHAVPGMLTEPQPFTHPSIMDYLERLQADSRS